MPGIEPWCASSRRQMRQRPNLRKTARGLPHRLHRVYARTLKRDGRDCLILSDFLATPYCSLLPSSPANGIPSADRSARACSSFAALVVIAMSKPRMAPIES
jgi:hypothetical protein